MKKKHIFVKRKLSGDHLGGVAEADLITKLATLFQEIERLHPLNITILVTDKLVIHTDHTINIFNIS